jgi:4-hydroxy-tetrahydrodipicolinate reductase
MKNICLIGSTGKMGKAIQEILNGNYVVNGFAKIHESILDTFNTAVSHADVVIDFSHADNVAAALQKCILNQKPYFCGTTNLSVSNFEAIKKAAEAIPIIYASNTSFGIAVLKKAVQLVTKEFSASVDIEISETHHRNKKDAPSGTALSLGEVIANTLGYELEQIKVTDRTNKPRSNTPQIGFTALRGGSVIGEHIVHFFSHHETIKLSHECLDRKVFADGAVKAAMWLCKQTSGLYTMEDMLGK